MVPNHEKMDIIMSIHICPIRWMNFGFEENGGKKTFSAKPKHQNHIFR